MNAYQLKGELYHVWKCWREYGDYDPEPPIHGGNDEIVDDFGDIGFQVYYI
jgi:hypothetical protein